MDKIMGFWWNFGIKGLLEVMGSHAPLKAELTSIRLVRIFPSWLWIFL